MKNRHRTNILIALLVLVLTAAGVLAIYPYIYRSSKANVEGFFEREEFVGDLYENGFVLYWRLMQQNAGAESVPVDVFFPDYAAKLRRESSSNPDAQWELDSLESNLWQMTSSWESNFNSTWRNLEYLVLEDGEVVLGSGSGELARLLSDGDDELYDRLASMYRYYTVLSYDGDGNISPRYIYGASMESVDRLRDPDSQRLFRERYQSYSGESLSYAAAQQLIPPNDITVIYAVPREVYGYSRLDNNIKYYEQNSLFDAGFRALYMAALAVGAVLGCVVVFRKRTWPDGGPGIAPAEVSFVIIGFAVAMATSLARILLKASKGDPLIRMGDTVRNIPTLEVPLPGEASTVFGFIVGYLFTLIILAATCYAVYSLVHIFLYGPKRYLRDHSLIVRLFRWCGRLFRHLFDWLSDIDLTEPGDKAILKILAANFVLLAILCSMWFFGIMGLVIYTIVLFFLLRRYMRGVKKKYNSLLASTEEMARGRLNVSIESDLGLFEPLGQELRKVQEGFRYAVDAEVKSQNMKTELITNVSHDLKTPLTAIITYIGLLKQEDITEEERRAYVDTLDKKSQRLKRLIDDLFEMSRANSGNVVLNRTDLDLVSLIMQVETEAEDELRASGVEIRRRFPEDRVYIFADGEKTSRIFENLIINVTKYSLPGTRAYIDMAVDNGEVAVEIKNISAEPPDFDAQQITERFVRGDRSRNTEGSGLGLFIARSFAEVQGGALQVATDGDLFKVVVQFPLSAGGKGRPEGESGPEPEPEPEPDPA